MGVMVAVCQTAEGPPKGFSENLYALATLNPTQNDAAQKTLATPRLLDGGREGDATSI